MGRRALSERQAWECETAAHPRCRCRCGGKLHGANRVSEKALVRELEPGDAHRPEPVSKRALVAKLRRVYGHALMNLILVGSMGQMRACVNELPGELQRLIRKVKRG